MRLSLRKRRENITYKCTKYKRDNGNIWNIYDSLVITEMQIKILRLNFFASKWANSKINVINVRGCYEMVTFIDYVNINYPNILGSYLVIRLGNV